MLNQVIPPYEGTQPFLYACYCAEDEALAFPILARMYNEGFRLFSALACRQDRNSTRGDSDFRSVQRLNASSSVILFMSHNMLERIRRSDPEVITAVKSPCLRTIVRLDDSEPSGDIYALSVPDHIEYSHGNDAPFWLYIYSNDSLEKCRGPWPEESKRLRLTESSYDDVTDEVISEEYQNIENILSGKPIRNQQPAEQPRYRDNSGYIMPTPDEYVYIPLDKTGDERFDEILDMLNAGEKHANDVITSQQNRLLAPPPAPVAEPYPEPDWNSISPVKDPEPEPLPEPEVEVAEEKEPEPIIEPLAAVQPAEPVPPQPVVVEEPKVEAAPEPVQVAEPEPAPVEEKAVEPEPVKQPETPSSVPVMVKSSSKNPPKNIKKKRTKVTAVKKSRLSHSGTSAHLTASPDSAALIENNMRERAYLQNYARRLVMEAMAETVPLMTAEALAAAGSTEEAAMAESPRKHSRKPTAPALEPAAAPVPATEPAPEAAIATAAETSSEEKPKARKNRHPHDHKGFNIFAAIRAARQERQNKKDHTDDASADAALTESDADDELLLEETSGESSTPVLEAAVSKFVKKAAGRR